MRRGSPLYILQSSFAAGNLRPRWSLTLTPAWQNARVNRERVISRYPRHNLMYCDAYKIISGRKSAIIVPPEPERTSQLPPDEPFPRFTALGFKTACDYHSVADYFSDRTNTTSRERAEASINIERRWSSRAIYTSSACFTLAVTKLSLARDKLARPTEIAPIIPYSYAIGYISGYSSHISIIPSIHPWLAGNSSASQIQLSDISWVSQTVDLRRRKIYASSTAKSVLCRHPMMPMIPRDSSSSYYPAVS